MRSMIAFSWNSCRLLARLRASISRGSVPCGFTRAFAAARCVRSGCQSCSVAAADVPRQQLVDAVDRMVGDALEHVAQVRLGIEAVELGRLHQAVDRRGALAARVGAGEQVVLAAEGDAAQRALGGVVVDLDAAVVAIAGQRRPALRRVADRLRQVATSPTRGASVSLQPGVQLLEQRRRRVPGVLAGARPAAGRGCRASIS